MTEYTKIYIETDSKRRMSIGADDDEGTGDGYRLAGPKFCGCCPGSTVVRVELDERDVEEIRSYLKIWDEIQAAKAEAAPAS
jgi:hypothetical protein